MTDPSEIYWVVGGMLLVAVILFSAAWFLSGIGEEDDQ